MEALYRLSYAGVWLRGPDSNRQPSDYEPDELPLLHPASIGGGGRIRTCEGCASRFTVCPRWPLGYPSTYSVVRAAGRVRPPLPGGTVTLHRPAASLIVSSQRRPVKERRPTPAVGVGSRWSWGWDSNPQPVAYKATALPIELPQPAAARPGRPAPALALASASAPSRARAPPPHCRCRCARHRHCHCH